MEEKRYVVGLGEALWDVLPEGKKLVHLPTSHTMPDNFWAVTTPWQ